MLMTVMMSMMISMSVPQLLGFTLLIVGMTATFFSPHRYLLGYALAGMLYWLVIEGLHLALTHMLPISSWHGYIGALAVTWLVPTAWVLYHAFHPKPVAEQL